MQMTDNIRKIIAGNVKRLMERDPDNVITQAEIASKTKLSQKSISNASRPDAPGSITTKTIEELAKFFNLEPYHLMIPNLPIEELLSKRIEKVIECYTQSPPDGRENIQRIAENEMRYSLPNQIPAKQGNGS